MRSFNGCIPERVGLAATTWAIFADRNINPFGNAATTVRCNGRVPNLLGTAGGMGKTQLAIEFAYRYSTDYDIVCWLKAEEPAALKADFAALAPSPPGLGVLP